MNSGAVYHRSADVIARRIGEEMVLVPVTRDGGDLENIFSLNEVGVRIWEAADGRTSVGEIVGRILDEFAVERAVAEADVEVFLTELAAAGLVTCESAEARA